MGRSSQQVRTVSIEGESEQTDDDASRSNLLATLTLSLLPGIGPRTLTLLLEHFGDPQSVIEASGEQLAAVPGVGPKLIHVIRTATAHVSAEAVLTWCNDQGVSVVMRQSPGYPTALGDLYDAPPILFVRGSVRREDEIAVAVVGTRHATTYGLRQAEHLSYSLARAGVTVISGLARGIDAAAHQGALSGGGRTVAVLGSGLGQVYPSEHQSLANEIAGHGALISEYAPDARPRSGLFPQRNRLIACMALATLVVEAPDRSGALITARLAGEQNREVMAVPGAVSSRASRGCNRLIRDGATLVQNVDDVLEALGPMAGGVNTEDGHQVRHGSELLLNDIERRVLNTIASESTMIDAVIRDSKLPAQRVLAIVSVLEMRRLIRRLSGQYVSRI